MNPLRPIAATALFLAGLPACGFQQAADAADAACLASIVQHVQEAHSLKTQGEREAWREWASPEVTALVGRLPEDLDCRGGWRGGPDLRTDLRARTRLRRDGVEVEFWLASRPTVRCCAQ